MRRQIVTVAALVATRYLDAAFLHRLACIMLAVGICLASLLGVDTSSAAPLLFIGMAAPADYLSSVDLKAITAGGFVNEDVLQKIFDISEIPTPFLDMIGESPCDNTYSEWVRDSLQAVDVTNKVVYGSDAGTTGQEKGGDAREGNHIQLSDKLVQVTDETPLIDGIGRGDEMAYQKARRLQELRRDVEAISLRPQASVADDNNTTAGQAAGFPSWLTDNDQLGTDGAATGFNTSTKLVAAVTAGDTRALTYAMLKNAIEAVYLDNGNPTTIMSRPEVVRRLNDYLFTSGAPIADPVANVNGTPPGVDMVAQGWINVLKTDYGFNLKIVPNRLQQTYASTDSTPATSCDVFLIDPSMVAIGYLGSYGFRPIAKLGHANRELASVYWTVKVFNQLAHAVIRDITPTGTVTTP